MPPCARCGAAFAAHADGECPRAEAVTPPWYYWPRRHLLLTGAILLAALLVGVGVGTLNVSSVSHPNGNATACGDYWKIEDTNPYNIWAEAAGWQDLQAASSGITDPTLSAAVAAFNADLSRADSADAESASTGIETACTALGYSDPG
jgi:hypothetical protein